MGHDSGAMSIEDGRSPLTVDPLASPGLRRELPGLAIACDGDRMRVVIGEVLLGGSERTDRCRPGKATYVAGDSAIIRYQLRIGSEERVVCGRVFPDAAASRRYVDDRLVPLAPRVAGRPETAPFSAVVAHVEPLALALSVFPLDGDLPMLVDATDPQRALDVLRDTVGEVFGRCEVDVVAYPRRGRCVLRYRLEPGNRTVYGKITAGGEGARTAGVVQALGRHLASRRDDALIAVPRCLGYDASLQLVLMDPVEGNPGIAPLLRGDPGAHGLTLLQLLERAAATGAALHRCELEIGDGRTFEVEIESLRGQLGGVRQHASELGDRLDLWLDRAEKLALGATRAPLGLAHGDFTHSQIVFDRHGGVGLLDFDDVCQAEPALDLGQFTAYLALSVAKSGAQVTGLEELFLAAYAEAAGAERDQLADRHAAYEICSLVRMAIHAWHKLKAARLRHVLDVLGKGARS